MLKLMGWSSSSMFEILLVVEQPATLSASGNTFPHFTIFSNAEEISYKACKCGNQHVPPASDA